MTNYEKIKAMTFDEMKNYLLEKIDVCYLCKHYLHDCRKVPCKDDSEIVKDWLKEEVGDGEF